MNECEVIPATIGEYTNLTDKNGRHIFGKCGGVRNCDHFGYEGFYVEPANDETRNRSNGLLRNDLHYWIDKNDVEVIGTVFDAPDVFQ